MAANPQDTPQCNICGSCEFQDMRDRPGVLCSGCGSLERTRVMKMYLDRYGFPAPGQQILHFAPELGLARQLSQAGDTYQAVDIDPKHLRYKRLNVHEFDICADVETLPTKHYDLILHSHVLEHVKCDITSVLWHIHRALKDGGLHICCIPVHTWTTYKEDLAPLSREEAMKEYMQDDHVRRWGLKDIQRTLGMALKLPLDYDLEREFGAETLDAANVPRQVWKGLNPSAVLVLTRTDMKLLN